MQITLGPTSIDQLLMGEHILTVPSFQRGYSWTKPQLEQYLKDVLESAVTRESHFYGPVVFLRLPNKNNHLQIVDGQQRITTVVMTLSILRDLANDLENQQMNEGTPAQFNLFQVIRTPLYLPPLLNQPRFTASYSIEKIFAKYILGDPGDGRPKLTIGGAGLTPVETRASRELRRAYIQIRDEITSKVNEQKTEDKKKELIFSIFWALTTGFEIHSMQLADENEAYVLFETLNDRGLKLNPSDLLKTLTLREIRQHGSPKDLDDALIIWDNMVQNLGEYEFSKFLRHYLLTVEKGPIQANKIYGLFKTRIEKKGSQGAYKNLSELAQASEVYSKLLDVSQDTDVVLRAGIVRMNSFSDTHRVFLLAIPSSDLKVETVKKLYRATEFLAYRWIAAGSNAQNLENLYQSLAHKLLKSPTEDTAEAVVDEILQKAPKDEDLQSMTRSDQVALQRYALRRIEEYKGGHLSWENPISIEHLAPQNPGVNGVYWYGQIGSPDEPDHAGMYYDDYVRYWGNLTLLEQKLNSSIGNAVWSKKVSGDASSNYDGLSASSLNLNKPIVLAPDWNLSRLTDRNEWVHYSVLDLVGSNWVKTGKNSLANWKA